MICPTCQTEFDTTDRRRRYCSNDCFAKAILDRDKARLAGERERRRAYAAQYRAAFPEKVRAAIAKVRGTPEGRARKQAADALWYANNRQHALRLFSKSYKRTRVEKAWAILLYAAKSRARKRGQAFDLTSEWAAARWTGLCEVSGIPFVLGATGKSGNIYSPSIDKIDPRLGYVQSNCRFVLFAVNALKHDGADDDMYRVAEAIISNRAIPFQEAAE